MSDSNESISDKLRRWADESGEKHIYPTTMAANELGLPGVDQGDECILFRSIADEVDAEKRAIYEAQEDCSGDRTSPHHIIKAYSEHIGKPMRDRECITDWLDRWFIPRPLFDDGQPVRFGDTFVTDSGYNATLSSLNYTKGDHDYVIANGGKRHKVTDRLKRPDPQVLDADGVPIEVGDMLWRTDTGERIVVGELDTSDCVRTKVGATDGHWHNQSTLTHREPDTQERIDEDAMKSRSEYWKCFGRGCYECPSKIKGRRPRDHYNVCNCSIAQTLDILRRQRELDGR